jgi:hypothetical protein
MPSSVNKDSFLLSALVLNTLYILGEILQKLFHEISL